MKQTLNSNGEAIQAFNTVGEGQVLTMTGSTVASTAIPTRAVCVKIQADGGDVVFKFGGADAVTVNTNTDPNKIFAGSSEMFTIPNAKRIIYANGGIGAKLRITYSSDE
jgi:hypothetical protein